MTDRQRNLSVQINWCEAKRLLNAVDAQLRMCRAYVTRTFHTELLIIEYERLKEKLEDAMLND